MTKDFAVSAVGVVQPSGAIGTGNIIAGSTISKKPSYLLELESGSGKSYVITRFITLDKPDFLNGFVQVKGIHCLKDKDSIIKSYIDILNSEPRENIVEMMFPNHRVLSIRSLVFNATKPTTIGK